MSKSSQRYLDENGPINPNQPCDNPTPLDVAMDHPHFHTAMGVAVDNINLVMQEQNGLGHKMSIENWNDMYSAILGLSIESVLHETCITKDKAYIALGYPVEDMPKSMFDDDFPPPF